MNTTSPVPTIGLFPQHLGVLLDQHHILDVTGTPTMVTTAYGALAGFRQRYWLIAREEEPGTLELSLIAHLPRHGDPSSCAVSPACATSTGEEKPFVRLEFETLDEYVDEDDEAALTRWVTASWAAHFAARGAVTDAVHELAQDEACAVMSRASLRSSIDLLATRLGDFGLEDSDDDTSSVWCADVPLATALRIPDQLHAQLRVAAEQLDAVLPGGERSDAAAAARYRSTPMAVPHPVETIGIEGHSWASALASCAGGHEIVVLLAHPIHGIEPRCTAETYRATTSAYVAATCRELYPGDLEQGLVHPSVRSFLQHTAS